MTTPVPTTAAAHLAMVGALRDIVGRDLGHRKYGCVPPVLCSESCPVATARAALEGWEERPRLRDDEALRSAVADVVAFVPGYASTRARLTNDILDALEPLLFGAGREAPAYGVLMCSECGCSSDNAKACNRDCPCHRTGPRTGGEQGEGGDRG